MIYKLFLRVPIECDVNRTHEHIINIQPRLFSSIYNKFYFDKHSYFVRCAKRPVQASKIMSKKQQDDSQQFKWHAFKVNERRTITRRCVYFEYVRSIKTTANYNFFPIIATEIYDYSDAKILRFRKCRGTMRHRTNIYLSILYLVQELKHLFQSINQQKCAPFWHIRSSLMGFLVRFVYLSIIQSTSRTS